ncbi:MAG: cytochrome c3 family protein [Gemmatimonadota bacterium]
MPRHNSMVRAIVLALVLAGCTTSDIVYRDREPFNAPPDAASGLLGYYNAATKQTTCGNCHTGHQARWKTTKHAMAHQTLVDLNTAPTATCWACHTVSSKGNGLTSPAGWEVKNDAAYKDVQCESCHGPGAKHVQNPEVRATWPLARIRLTVAGASCASCHSGAHHPFADEWKQSLHNAVATTNTCGDACHNGKTVLAAWGVNNSNYVERDSAGASEITCAVCHDPHGSPNKAMLRFPIDNPNPDQNLCMKCHMRRGEPEAGRSTPHAPQGFVLLGTGGYRPSGVSIDTLISLTTHASSANPRLCAGCHVNRYSVTDPATGAFVFTSTGHLFKPIPCTDATGKPVGDTTCAYAPPTRSFKSCTSSGCHASEAIAAGRLSLARSEIETLAAQIWIDSNKNQTIDPAPIDGGYLAIIRRDMPGELTNPTVITPARGAEFNVKTFGEGRYGNGDRSKGVHNPFLARALLGANIVELRARYALPAPPAAVNALIARSLQAAAVRQPQFLTTKHRTE